ncbi:MAG: hypothetical protein WC551_08325 [Patescibacteria group bacterium]
MLSNTPYERDTAARRKAPRHCIKMKAPLANLRGHYRIGLTLIKQLEATANLLNVEPYADLAWVKKGGRRVTTSDVVRALLRLGYRKAGEDSRSHLDVIWEEIIRETPDEMEEAHHLTYTFRKYG